MGYRSRLRIEATITKLQVDEESNSQELLRRAEALGHKMSRDSSMAESRKLVSDWLSEDDALGFFTYVEDSDDSLEEIELLSTGESGRCNSIARDLKLFCLFLTTNNLRLDGTIWREGEGLGDLQRIKITSSSIVADDRAKLVFDDGTGVL